MSSLSQFEANAYTPLAGFERQTRWLNTVNTNVGVGYRWLGRLSGHVGLPHKLVS